VQQRCEQRGLEAAPPSPLKYEIILDRRQEHADAAHSIRLLRARCGRPGDRCDADACHEVAPPHLPRQANDHGQL
jgi:hypothetical protein